MQTWKTLEEHVVIRLGPGWSSRAAVPDRQGSRQEGWPQWDCRESRTSWKRTGSIQPSLAPSSPSIQGSLRPLFPLPASFVCWLPFLKGHRQCILYWRADTPPKHVSPTMLSATAARNPLTAAMCLCLENTDQHTCLGSQRLRH